MKKILNKKGFTLIEMLVSMMIFVTFISVLISSYTDIVKSQREANDYRMLYSEARHVFEKLTEEARNNAIYYKVADKNDPSFSQEYGIGGDDIRLISVDGQRQVVFEYKDENIVFGEIYDGGLEGIVTNTYPLISEESERISITEFNVFVSPIGDPYRSENIFEDGIQFQPKITFVATFVMERRKGGTPYTIDLQTTISSRLYSESPKVDVLTIF